MRNGWSRWSRLALVAMGATTMVIMVLTLVGPMGQSSDAHTFCYPLFGPVQRFDPSLAVSELPRVRAHEDAHAAQCRRDGAVWHNLRRVVTSQRLQAEAEAYCAEVRFAVLEGGRIRLEYARVRDELRETQWFRRRSSDELSTALAAQCPDLAAAAIREEADWQDRARGTRALQRKTSISR